jgi:HSP20 family protein
MTPPRRTPPGTGLPGEVDRLLAELCAGARAATGAEAARAPVDVYLSDDPPALTVELDVAGIDPETAEIALHDDVLVVRGERRPAAGPRRVYHHAEIAWGPFERRIRLNVPVDPDRASAAYDRGLLTITLPLAARAPARRVVIGVRRAG